MPRTQSTLEVGVEPAQLMRVILDFPSYPAFLPEMRLAEVVARGTDWWDVRFHLQIVRPLEYTLHLVRESDLRVSWRLVDGIFKSNDGAWDLVDLSDGRTRATYAIDIVFGLFVPSTIVNTLVGKSLPDTLVRFRDRAESLARSGDQAPA
jgi:ribosome-associated toxin RatA of RatAB toxin-antitoxin module